MCEATDVPDATVTFSAHTIQSGDASTILDDQFCQNYFPGGDADDCKSLRTEVQTEVRAGVPTLEVGDRSLPAMVFFHGWPDTAAIWAQQFEYFCGSRAKSTTRYFCVAPSNMNFNPDYPLAEKSDLFLDVQVDKFHGALEELKLKDITLVMFDFGSNIGFKFAYRFPTILGRVIVLDTPMSKENLNYWLDPVKYKASLFYSGYQKGNVEAYLENNDTTMSVNMNDTLGAYSMAVNAPYTLSPPCYNCTIAPQASGIGAQTGWLYNTFVNDAEGEVWTERLAPGVPINEWEFNMIPSFPDTVPLYFLFSSIGVEIPYLQWIKARDDGSDWDHLQAKIGNYSYNNDHWFSVRFSAMTNKHMEDWLKKIVPDVSDDQVSSTSYPHFLTFSMLLFVEFSLVASSYFAF
eukprot:CAMPEP_0197833074 /NCGR_PEP_ID=MMETSP1437-20131217/17600_1 /TAXON_ID=49252 ORGANISM="Eucampia antarctica, Strain CCMP1452" /NCGR_SAMPLE_ID=MMETSP1437 /ASSEMBLY_ACC=CAM_ASM_001096 /LENGTH=404 /DNA_ID=CAMNT_0043436873 /DNA_START=37 /DNA_END=1252 /DNA_ORIENTATION=+